MILSSIFSLTFFRISEEQDLNQALLQSTMSLYAGSSHSEMAVSSVKPVKSTELLVGFENKIGVPLPTPNDPLELNQGISTAASRRALALSSDFVPQEYFDSGAEVYLSSIKKTPADNIDFIRIEYCDRIKDQDVCETSPELIIDWFELQPGFRFYDLAELSNTTVQSSFVSDCLEPLGLKLKRCVVRTSQPTNSAVEIKNATAENPYSKVLLFRTEFSRVDQYLFRFRTISRLPVHFRMMGQKGVSGTPKIVQLPTAFLDSDETATVRSSFRRVRQQQLFSAGLQDSLEFVHYGEEVMNK